MITLSPKESKIIAKALRMEAAKLTMSIRLMKQECPWIMDGPDTKWIGRRLDKAKVLKELAARIDK